MRRSDLFQMTVRLSALVLVLVALAGCDTTIERPDSLEGSYTLWGALNPTTDVQAVRVSPVDSVLKATSAAPLPVTVVSIDLATGAETAWRDSVVTFRNGTVGHIYSAAFRPAYGGRYRLAVRRNADGGEVSAETTVPRRALPVVQPATFLGGTRLPVLWPEAPQLNRIRVTYLVQDRETCGSYLFEVGLSASSGTSGPVGAGSEVVLNLSTIAPVLRSFIQSERPVQIGLLAVTLAAEVASVDWRPPGNVFDFEALASPEVFGNVDGGFGLVGAAYPATFTFLPSQNDLSRTTFVNTTDRCGALPEPPPSLRLGALPLP